MCANILVIVFFIVSCPSIKRGIIHLTIIFYAVVLYLYFSVFTANPLSEGTRKNCKCDDRWRRCMYAWRTYFYSQIITIQPGMQSPLREVQLFWQLLNNYWMRSNSIWRILKEKVCVICRTRRQITQNIWFCHFLATV